MDFRFVGGFAFEREYGMNKVLEEGEEDEEVRPAHRLRRKYKIFPRINMDNWDDTDFVSRSPKGFQNKQQRIFWK